MADIRIWPQFEGLDTGVDAGSVALGNTPNSRNWFHVNGKRTQHGPRLGSKYLTSTWYGGPIREIIQWVNREGDLIHATCFDDEVTSYCGKINGEKNKDLESTANVFSVSMAFCEDDPGITGAAMSAGTVYYQLAAFSGSHINYSDTFNSATADGASDTILNPLENYYLITGCTGGSGTNQFSCRTVAANGGVSFAFGIYVGGVMFPLGQVQFTNGIATATYIFTPMTLSVVGHPTNIYNWCRPNMNITAGAPPNEIFFSVNSGTAVIFQGAAS